MPNIKPISDLRNYTTVINEVTYGICNIEHVEWQSKIKANGQAPLWAASSGRKQLIVPIREARGFAFFTEQSRL